MIVPVILAGGSGTRLWPLSRQLYPKQLMTLIGQGTMLQQTVRRLDGLKNVAPPIVLCNEAHRFLVAEQLRSEPTGPAAIILEPVGRNTAPAVAVAALTALKNDADAVLVVLPADHFISDADLFREKLTYGFLLAQKGSLITFGVVPTSPETGYGYIKKGPAVPAGETDSAPDQKAFAIDAFVEKPDRQTAKAYLASGQYCWNSGMFMFSARTVLQELERFSPEIVAACRDALAAGKRDLDFFRLATEAFGRCPTDSIDYAVMEKTDRGTMIPLDAGWSDLGSWESLWEAGPKTEDNNIVVGEVLAHNTEKCYLHADSRLIAAVGLSNHVVVETADAVLVASRNSAQEVKKIVDTLNAASREEARSHTVDHRPWGYCERLLKAERFQINRLLINAGQKLSLQKHLHRSEHWLILSGSAQVTKGGETVAAEPEGWIHIPPETPHRLENPGADPLEVLEVQSGARIRPDDVERLADDYGR